MGCASSPMRRHPDFPVLWPEIHRILCILPEISIVSEEVSGDIVLDQESERASEETGNLIAQTLSSKGFTVTVADSATMQTPEVQSMVDLFRVVNRSIQLHTYGPQPFKTKQAAFEYAIGPVSELLGANRADALVLAIGRQTGTQTWLSIAIADLQGRLLWYALGEADERLKIDDPDQAQRLVDKTLLSLAGSSS